MDKPVDERWATFLFTDIAGSTKLWELYPNEMDGVLAQHDQVLHQVVESHHGQVFKTVGDAIYAAFQIPADALEAAIEGQLALLQENWPGVKNLHVRMALHMGVAVRREGDFYGPTLNRLSRLLSAGHGGQIILSQSIADGVIDQLPPGISLRDLGQHRLKDLSRPEHIFQADAPGLPDVFPALRTLDYRPHNLPLAINSFVGREQELANVKQLLSTKRLVTLIGPAGTGKTRLGLQAAAESVEDFNHGVFFVSLAAIRNPDLVPKTIADTLQITVNERETVVEALMRHFQDRHLLLVLDNFEQIINAGPTLGDLLMNAPQLHIVVTSRQPLDIYGEHVYPVAVLEIPGVEQSNNWRLLARNDSVELFVQRAKAAKPDFMLIPENAGDIADICRRLDGLPLAIELAAARIKYFSPATLRQRLSSRLQFLTTGPRDAPARQRTMRQAIDWSYQLLEPKEQAVFALLGVFVGGWSQAAAEALIVELLPAGLAKDQEQDQGSVFDTMTSLLDKNLIQMYETQEGDIRFSMLELIREYALERLSESSDLTAARSQHLAYFTSLAEEFESQLAEMSIVAKHFSLEYDNIRSAIEWAVGRSSIEAKGKDKELVVRLIAASGIFWYGRGFLSEGRRWLDVASNFNPEANESRAKVLVGNGILAWQQGDYVPSQVCLEEGVAIYRQLANVPGLARALHFLGHLTFDRRDYSAADAYFEESLALYQKLGHQFYYLVLLSDTGMVAYHQGDVTTAKERFEKALNGFRAQEWDSSVADQLNRLGELARLEGAFDEAEALYRESLNLFEIGEESLGVASSQHKLAQVSMQLGDPERAQALLKESLDSQRRAGNKQGIAECLAAYAGLVIAADRVDLSAKLGGVTEAFLEELGAPLSPADWQDFESAQSEAINRLGEHRYQENYQIGHTLSVEQGIIIVHGLELDY